MLRGITFGANARVRVLATRAERKGVGRTRKLFRPLTHTLCSGRKMKDGRSARHLLVEVGRANIYT